MRLGGGLLIGAMSMVFAASVGLASSGDMAPPGAATPPSTMTVQAPQAAADCVQCHSGPTYEGMASFHQQCTTCHSNAPAHLADPQASNIGKPAANDCLSCHTRSARLLHWESGPHARNQLVCSDCHKLHASGAPSEFKNVANRRLDAASAGCVTCHAETLASFSLPSHHPVREGGLSCVSCHDPHGGDKVQQLSKTDRCVKCHASHRGPWVFEHEPAAEDCANCHVSHGSANRRLLELPMPTLCLQCHTLADNRHAVGAVAGARVTGAAFRNCAGCHAALHGSVADVILRR